jgi:hypothetical protein
MGPAVSDAAAWYDKADWIGINATPHATMYIQSLIEGSSTKLDHLIIDYDVPLKGTPSAVCVKTINWPKAFWVQGLRPAGTDTARAMLLRFLAQHQAPRGTESKYFNALKFFDYIVKNQKPGKKKLQTARDELKLLALAQDAVGLRRSGTTSGCRQFTITRYSHLAVFS